VASDFRAQVEAQRPYLLRYASMELRNSDAAEDAVQETLLAALTAEASFAGRSNLRTWLTGILKHKIVDSIRRSSRERPLESSDGESTVDDFDALFDETGHWCEPPQAWPEQALQEKQFLQALEKCLAALPARTSQVFMMREHLASRLTISVRNSASPRPTAGYCSTAHACRCATACKKDGWVDEVELQGSVAAALAVVGPRSVARGARATAPAPHAVRRMPQLQSAAEAASPGGSAAVRVVASAGSS